MFMGKRIIVTGANGFIGSHLISELVASKEKSQLFANQVFKILLFSLFFLVLVIELFMPLFVGILGFLMIAYFLQTLSSKGSPNC